MRWPEHSTSLRKHYAWVWRLRPLGHTDYGDQSIVKPSDEWCLRERRGKNTLRSLSFVGTWLTNEKKTRKGSVSSGIWTHASMRWPEHSTSLRKLYAWVWRLRPLGHTDYGDQTKRKREKGSVSSGIWTHASMRWPEHSTSLRKLYAWVWRLRPLGHTDYEDQFSSTWILDEVSEREENKIEIYRSVVI